MVNPTGQEEYYLDENLKAALDTERQVIKKDWDFVNLVDGGEGSGKSKIAKQMAKYVDPTFDLSHIAFTAQQFKKLVLNANQYAAIVYDEAYTGLNSKGAMGFINRALVEMLAEVRQRNLFIFVVMPTFFELVRYVALWRSRCLIHVYTGDNFQRGYFAFYNVDQKKGLYILGKKFFIYKTNEPMAKPNFIGRFTNYDPVDVLEYNRLKRVNLKNKEAQGLGKEQDGLIMDGLFRRLQECKNEALTHTLKMEILGIPYGTYWHRLKTYTEQQDLNSEPNDSIEEITSE